MEMRPFLLDQWLSKHQFASPPIEYDLASSTGPRWTVRELLALVDDDMRESVFDRPLYYAPPEGGAELREAIAAATGVTADDVRITTGASEALWMLLIDAAEAGANVVLPHPGFPTFDEAARVLGLEVRHYHLRAESGFRIDLDEVRSRSDRRTKLILVNSPHNPTGAVIGDAELDELHDFTGQRGVSPHLSRPCGALGQPAAGRDRARRLLEGAVPQRFTAGLDRRAGRGPSRAVREHSRLLDGVQLVTPRRGTRRHRRAQPRSDPRADATSHHRQPPGHGTVLRRARRADRMDPAPWWADGVAVAALR